MSICSRPLRRSRWKNIVSAIFLPDINLSRTRRSPSSIYPRHITRSFSEQQKVRDSLTDGAVTDDVPPSAPVADINSSPDNVLARYREYFEAPKASHDWERWAFRDDHISTIHGYVAGVRQGGKEIDFVDLVDPSLRKVLQLVVDANVVSKNFREAVRKLRAHTPVVVYGQMRKRTAAPPKSPPFNGDDEPNIVYHTSLPPADAKGANSHAQGAPSTVYKKNRFVGAVTTLPHFEMAVTQIKSLNGFPIDTIAQADTTFPPEQRHLQLRTDSTLRDAIRMRSRAQLECHKLLHTLRFDEIDTPILFKSTPEGAREFLVPTRQPGLAYALPQSPQQFKQILMASGISRYFQFARCFRDEDSRADRQPEFSQLDLEMSFASSRDVMLIIERLITMLWKEFSKKSDIDTGFKQQVLWNAGELKFPCLSYNDAMSLWGSDKPDTRYGSRIFQVQDLIDPALRGRFARIEDPIIDLIRIRMAMKPEKSRDWISKFLDRPIHAAFAANPHGSAGIFIFDPSKPLNGLSALEHQAAEGIVELLHPQRGDLLVLQARPNRPFQGEGSTAMGALRRELHQSLIHDGIMPRPRQDEFLWINQFPLFSPTSEGEPGHGGMAGIKSTHHPFTAPESLSDIDKLVKDPLSCKADHFDLVINGIEIGGGSCRIHDSQVQEMVLRDILKLPEMKVEQFRPLLEALRAGCPPHAGIALGFDRLMTILAETDGVRNVMAFPKSSNGCDKTMGAPSVVEPARWAEYHLLPQEVI